MKNCREIPISKIEGFKIGNSQNEKGATGCTAIICEEGAIAGVDVRGGAPATRETDLLNPMNSVERIHCVMLSGGSAYGLAAADGAMKYLEERGTGFDVGVGVVPIVCGAALFDLVVGDPSCRPDREMGYDACVNSQDGKLLMGNFGAGTGASVGKLMGTKRMMKGGLGSHALQIGNVKCGAIVAVNPLGDVLDAGSGQIIAGILDEDGSKIGSTEKILMETLEEEKNVFSGNTTIGCIITNGILTKANANKLASIAHDGLARVIRPVHTSVDGDTVFVMSTNQVKMSLEAMGALAAKVMERAINVAVNEAEEAYGLLSASSFK